MAARILESPATYKKSGGASLAEVEKIWAEALRLTEPGEHVVSMTEALRLAASSGASAYDAQYVALAQLLGVPLVTEDRRLRKAFPSQLLSMQEFCDAKR